MSTNIATEVRRISDARTRLKAIIDQQAQAQAAQLSPDDFRFQTNATLAQSDKGYTDDVTIDSQGSEAASALQCPLSPIEPDLTTLMMWMPFTNLGTQADLALMGNSGTTRGSCTLVSGPPDNSNSLISGTDRAVFFDGYTSYLDLPDSLPPYSVPNTGSGSGQALKSTGTIRLGEKVKPSSALVGIILTEVDLWLWRFGSPTGTATVCIRSGVDDSVAVILGSIDVSTLAMSITSYQFFCPTNNHVLAANDILSVEYSGGDNSNGIYVSANGNDVYDGTNSAWAFYTSSWSTYETWDLAGTFYVKSGTTNMRMPASGGFSFAIRINIKDYSLQLDNTTHLRTIACKSDDASNAWELLLSSTNGDLLFHVKRAGVEYKVKSTGLSLNTWYDIVCTYAITGNVATIYRNNVASTTADTTASQYPGDLNLHIGRADNVIIPGNEYGFGAAFDPYAFDSQAFDTQGWLDPNLLIPHSVINGGFWGALHDPRLYNIVLSSAQVGYLYTNKLSISNIAKGAVASAGYCISHS